MSPLSSALPRASSPPQMNTDLPIATDAAFERATVPTGGAFMLTQPALHTLPAQLRPWLQALPQPPQCSALVAVSMHIALQQLSKPVQGLLQVGPPPAAPLLPAVPALPAPPPRPAP